MILPIQCFNFSNFEPVHVNEEVLLVKEKINIHDSMAIVAYTNKGEIIGYVSQRSTYNAQVRILINNESVIGKIWSISQNQILVELESNLS